MPSNRASHLLVVCQFVRQRILQKGGRINRPPVCADYVLSRASMQCPFLKYIFSPHLPGPFPSMWCWARAW
jgi:hypothetical protein